MTMVILLSCVISAGQETAKQALQEIVILPALRPEVGLHSSYKAVVTITQHDYDVNAYQSRTRGLQSGTGISVVNFPTRIRYE